MTKVVQMEKPASNALKPRICFLNRAKCKECGNCQKTYYCDSFLDRVNTEKLLPVMDTRNCTGCGLCVQVCGSKALHLYHPKEFVVLISSSQERRELLQCLNIPYLVFDPEKDFKRFSQTELRNLRINMKEGVDQTSIIKLNTSVKTIWAERLKEKFILGDNSDDYKDSRYHRQSSCETTAQTLINEIDDTHPQRNLALARAALWSQLIWSDPGQVLWDSFLLTVQTYLESTSALNGQKMVWETENTGDSSNLQPGNFEEDKWYRVSSYVVLLRQGEVLLSREVQSTPFQFSKKIFRERAMVKSYNHQEMGKNRLAGLDIRSCGHFLIENFENIQEKDRLAMAGLPWLHICELLNNVGHGSHANDFKEMCTAIKKRYE